MLRLLFGHCAEPVDAMDTVDEVDRRQRLIFAHATLFTNRVCTDRFAGELLIEEEAMKRTILGLALVGLMSAGSLMAQDRDDWRPNRDVRHDYADRRGDYRDMRNDRAKIAHDQWELRRDLRNGNYSGAREERQELRSEYRDVNHDRRDVRRDTRDIRNDRFWGWR